jgi:hypothetical protein
MLQILSLGRASGSLLAGSDMGCKIMACAICACTEMKLSHTSHWAAPSARKSGSASCG